MEDFFGFEKNEFEFEGKKAVVVFADKKNRTDKWLLKTEYFGAFPELEIMMLKKGYNIAHVENETRWCLDLEYRKTRKFLQISYKRVWLFKKMRPGGYELRRHAGNIFCGEISGVYSGIVS